MDNEKNIIAGNVVTQIIGRVIVLSMALITVKLISNFSGTEGTGYYNTVITYLSFFIAIADFGLFSIGVREIAKNPSKRQELLDNIFTIRLISAFTVTLIAVIISQLTSYPPIIKNGVLVASIFLFLNLVGSVFELNFQTKMQMSKVATAEVFAKIASLILLIIVIFLKLPFIWVIATVSFSAMINFLVKFIATDKSELPKIAFDKKIASDIVRLALPFGMIFILNNFYFKVDTLILFHFKGASEVGIYSVAYRVLEVTLFAAAYLAYSLKPLLSSKIESDKIKAASATSKGITFLLFMALTVSVLCIPFTKEIIVFLSNSSFVAGAPIITILTFAGIFIYINFMISEVLIAKDSRKYLLSMSIAVLLFNVIANLLLIPRFSYYAAAFITLASETLIFILGFYKAKKIIPIKLDYFRIAKLLFSATAAIVLGILLRNLNIYFIIAMLISTGFYFGFVYLIDAIPSEMVRDYVLSVKKDDRN